MTHHIRSYPTVSHHRLEEVAHDRDRHAASAPPSPAVNHPAAGECRSEQPRLHHRSAMQMALLAQVSQSDKTDLVKQWDAWAQERGTSGEDRAEAVMRMKEWLENHQPDAMLSLDGLGLTTLPKLPDTLKGLDISGNDLTSLPEHLPKSLESLDVSDNRFTSLPQHLPDTLQDLGISDNRLTSLPERLPQSLKYLYASDNRLTRLPDLPDSLQCLSVSNNALTSLPEHLPTSLKDLAARGNQLSSLPKNLTTRLGPSCVVDVCDNPLHESVRMSLRTATKASDYCGPQIYFSQSPLTSDTPTRVLSDTVSGWFGESSRKAVKKTWNEESAAQALQAVWKGSLARRHMAAQAQQTTPYPSQLAFQQATFGFSIKNLEQRPIGAAQRSAEYQVYSSPGKIPADGYAFLHSFQRVSALKAALTSYSTETNGGTEGVYSPMNAGAERHDMKLNSAWLLGLAHHGKSAVLTTPLDDETLVRQSARTKPANQRNTEHNFSALGREVLGMVQNGHFEAQYDDRRGLQVLVPTAQARLATLEDFKTPSGMKQEEIRTKLAAGGIDVSKIGTSS